MDGINVSATTSQPDRYLCPRPELQAPAKPQKGGDTPLEAKQHGMEGP